MVVDHKLLRGFTVHYLSRQPVCVSKGVQNHGAEAGRVSQVFFIHQIKIVAIGMIAVVNGAVKVADDASIGMLPA